VRIRSIKWTTPLDALTSLSITFATPLILANLPAKVRERVKIKTMFDYIRRDGSRSTGSH
jgi:hypothetical protein